MGIERAAALVEGQNEAGTLYEAGSWLEIEACLFGERPDGGSGSQVLPPHLMVLMKISSYQANKPKRVSKPLGLSLQALQ